MENKRTDAGRRERQILRAAGVSAILAVGVDCWIAGLLFCDSVLLCCYPVVLGFGVCCALGFQGAISLLSWFCFADRFAICSLTGTYTPTAANWVLVKESVKPVFLDSLFGC